MKITIDFQDNDLQDALKLYLSTGISMQAYIRVAILFFGDCYRKETEEGFKIGYGKSPNFERYNDELSPKSYI